MMEILLVSIQLGSYKYIIAIPFLVVIGAASCDLHVIFALPA